MEVKQIEVVRKWPEPKSIQDIQVFLSFANFYLRFIQGFNKITAPLISILKTTGLPNKPASSRNDGSNSASNRNNDSKPASGRNDGNGEVDGFDEVEHAKKLEKLKGEKWAKSWKSFKFKGEKSKKNGKK